jgi:hypothetical protein
VRVLAGARAAGRGRWLYLAAVTLVALAVLTGVTGVIDHRNVQVHLNRLERNEWFCEHKGLDCGGPSSRAAHAKWERREDAYKLALLALSASAVAFGLGARRQSGR